MGWVSRVRFLTLPPLATLTSMRGNAPHRFLVIEGGGEAPLEGAPSRRGATLRVISNTPLQAEPEPPPTERIGAAQGFRRALEARIARPLEDLLP